MRRAASRSRPRRRLPPIGLSCRNACAPLAGCRHGIGPRSRLQQAEIPSASPQVRPMPDDQDPLAWRPRMAPSLVEFEVLAADVYARLPQKFRALCEGLVIRVEDFPTDEVLDEMAIDSEFGLLGLLDDDMEAIEQAAG